MISRQEMMGVLIEACPAFAPQWEAFQLEWQEKDEGDLPHYLVLGDFSRYVVELLERGDTQQLLAAFSAIERLHIEGEHYVAEAATVGILENLQNTNLHKNGTEPEQFRPYLQPVSNRWWDKLYRFWGNGELLRDD